MRNSFAKLIIFLSLIGGVFFVIDFFDIHIKEPESVGEEQHKVDQTKFGSGPIRKEQQTEVDSFQGTIDDIIELVNNSRKQDGLSELQKNEKLVESALLKALDMKEKDYFEHVSPEGLQPWFFVEQAGYAYKTVGENLAEGYSSASEVHEAWMGSEGHRKNVLSQDFEEIGVAVVEIEKNGSKSYISVQHFGSELKKQEVSIPVMEIVICDKKVKKDCDLAEEKKEEIKDTIEKQEDAIEQAKDDGYSEKELQKLYANLEKLKDIKKDIKDYLKSCDEYIDKCDKWE